MSSKIISGTTNKLIVSFSGQGNGMGTLPQFEFVNFLQKYFPDYEKHFYLDTHSVWYHKGIEGISTTISETVTYLYKQIQNFTEVTFIGSSAGGYAAILFGSLLGIQTVIAFKPQTRLARGLDKNYCDVKPYMNPGTTYYIYGDITVKKENDPLHHISHCNHINRGKNVHLCTDYVVDLRTMRDKGELEKIMKGHLLGVSY